MGSYNQKELPVHIGKPARAGSRLKPALLLSLAPLGLFLNTFHPITRLVEYSSNRSLDGHSVSILKAQCSQVDPLFPEKTSSALDEILTTISTPAYKKKSIDYLSGAVQIPTVSRDDMGPPGKDARWEIFYDFAAYLEQTFPLVHANLELEKINTHGLLYTWKGSNSSLKPTLLLAHQDVVPVPQSTVPTWTHPPFSGFFDGKQIWGRGSSDDKNQLIAILESIELLLKAAFVPQRTTIVSLGFDEESAGSQGAGSLSPVILARYGPNSIATIVDEGSGISKIWGQTFAAPGVAEKGAVNVVVVIRMPGGHSSIPPRHTSIGVISELIQLIEEDTYPTFLDAKNPYYSQMVCGASHAPAFPKPLKKLLQKSSGSSDGKKTLAKEAAKQSLFTKYLMTTSIAVDVIVGGEKSNALPEESTVTINHRVNIGDSIEHVKAKIERLAAKVAKKHNLTLQAYKGEPIPSSITLSAPGQLPVAPVTPTLTNDTTAYSVLSGTTRALYGEDMFVTPSLMTGNTDTRFYWDLSENIFRFAPGFGGEEEDPFKKIHTVDESVSVENHFAAIKWFVLFIRNMDEAALA